MILLFFKVVSGLKVNLSKSILVPMGNVNNVDLASILGCGTSYKAKSIWDGIMEKMEHRLASWICLRVAGLYL